MIASRTPNGRFLNWSRAVGTLLYPGLVTIINLALVGLIGPLVFAIRADLPFPTSYVGITYSLFFTASAITSSFGSKTLGRFRPATVAQFGLILSSLLCITTSFAWSSSYFIFAAVVGGLLNGLATPAVSMVIVQTLPHKRRGLGLGVRVAAAPVATSLAAVGVVIIEYFDASWRTVFVAYGLAGLVIFALALMMRIGQRKLHGYSDSSVYQSTQDSGSSPLPSKGLGLLTVAGFFGATGTSFFPAFLVESLVESGLEISTAALFVATASWIGIVSRVVIGGVSDKTNTRTAKLWMMVAILATALVGMSALAFGTHIAVLGFGALAALGIGWAWAGLIHHAAIELFPSQAARATSSVQTATYGGTVAGALLFGFVAQKYSFTLAWIAPLLSIAITLLLLLRVIRQITLSHAQRVPAEQSGDVNTR